LEGEVSDGGGGMDGLDSGGRGAEKVGGDIAFI
jgi:hypothetical protein